MPCHISSKVSQGGKNQIVDVICDDAAHPDKEISKDLYMCSDNPADDWRKRLRESIDNARDKSAAQIIQ